MVNYEVDVVAYGLKEGEVFGVIINTVLKFYKDIDTVTLYLNPKRQSDFEEACTLALLATNQH